MWTFKPRGKWIIVSKLPGRVETFWLDGCGWVYDMVGTTRFDSKEEAEAAAVGLQFQNERAVLSVRHVG